MKLSTLATSVALLASLPALAYTDLGDITINSLNSLNGAGAINVTTTGNIVGTFNTYCIENDEGISQGFTYSYDVGLIAYLGGDNTNSGDPLSRGAAYLYSKYGHQSLTAQQQADLQETIWTLEREDSPYASNGYRTEVVNMYGSLALARQNYDGGTINGVQVVVLNLFRADLPANSQHRQDLLACLPVGVPDGGATLLLLGAGLTAVGVSRRRMA
jgi:hypothetical protein